MGPKPVNWWFVTCWPNYNIQYGKAIGLYRDDGLGIFKESPRETENIKKTSANFSERMDLRLQ